ncbi:hypothetical protein [Sphingomonas sp.]|uniref:hypothetical protein n=1 Tax=Sphingomonas sp. TaxID=28214 RepID=UPI003CC66D81
MTDTQTVRIEKKAKVGRAQSRQPLSLTFDTKHVTPTDEVDKLTQRVALVMTMLNTADYDLRHWQRSGLPREPHQQYIEASKPNARWMNLQEHEEALRQGRPTSDFVFD